MASKRQLEKQTERNKLKRLLKELKIANRDWQTSRYKTERLIFLLLRAEVSIFCIKFLLLLISMQISPYLSALAVGTTLSYLLFGSHNCICICAIFLNELNWSSINQYSDLDVLIYVHIVPVFSSEIVFSGITLTRILE